MILRIDTGTEIPQAKSAVVEQGQSINLTDGRRAERYHRQIIDAVQECETAHDLDTYWERESLLVDALYMNWPEFYDLVKEAYDEHRAIITCKRDPVLAQADPYPAAPGNPTAQNGKTTKEKPMNMFSNIDTGSSGSEGPWLQWSARGTQDGDIPPKSFLIRDEGGKTLFEGFTQNGVVLDVENMQTGWCYSSGAVGEAPTWKMNPSLDRFMPSPGEDYKKGFKMRVAIGGGKTASWDQSGAGAWNAFVALIPELQKQPAPGKLPLVKMTDVKHEQFKRGSTQTPILSVVQWVDRPDCLKEGVQAGIASEPAPAPAASAPAATETPAPEGAEF